MGVPPSAEAPGPPPLAVPGCFWLRRGLSPQRSLLLRPFSNMGLLFFSPWGT